MNIKNPVLDYSNCFLGHSYVKKFDIENNSDFPAQFTITEQDEEAKSAFSYRTIEGKDIIAPRSTKSIKMTVEVKRLGQVNFPVFIKTSGREDVPIAVDVVARGIGPRVILSPSELNWGKIPVLENRPFVLSLHNDSLIAAKFECSVFSSFSVFTVTPTSGTIAPGEVFPVNVSAFLDDTLQFSDILKVMIHMGSTFEIPLEAKGSGTTIRINDSMKDVNFANVFSNVECKREFIVTNKGRRTQTLVWTREEGRRNVAKTGSTAVAASVFQIQPSRFSLLPGDSQVLQIVGFSSIAKDVKELISCFGYYEKSPTKKLLLQAEVAASFVNPIVTYLPDSLHFVSKTFLEANVAPIVQQVEIKNVTLLPVNMNLRSTPPFTILQYRREYTLQPDESVVIEVAFDPNQGNERVSRKENGKLIVTFRDHPQKNFVNLVGEVTFPNVSLETSEIKFGCILPYTECRQVIKMRNPGEIPVDYSWSLLNDRRLAIELENNKVDSEEVILSQIFNISPISGTLLPGAEQSVEAVFYGYAAGSFDIAATCSVVGGPRYDLLLSGSSSSIQYEIDRQHVDFGSRPFAEISLQEFNIVNHGDVSFDFRIMIPSTCKLSDRMAISPKEGRVEAGSKQTITVNLCAGAPEKLAASFLVQIAHFEPQSVSVSITGLCPAISVDLPKVVTSEQKEIIERSRQEYQNERRILPSIIASDLFDLQAPNSDETTISDQEELFKAFAEKENVVQANERLLQKLSSELIRKAKNPVLTFVGSPVLYYKSSQHTNSKKAVHSLPELSKTVVAQYSCDFGYVVRNSVEKQVIRIQNHGDIPVSIFIDRSKLANSGFQIGVDKIKNLQSKDSFEVEVLFASKFAPDNGVCEVDAMLEVYGGLCYSVCLKARVVTPDLSLSSTNVDFGEVFIGQRKTIFIQISNDYPVVCEWSAKQVPAKEKVTKKSRQNLLIGKEFEITPQAGCLQAGEKMNLMIRFLPSASTAYQVAVPLRINMNRKVANLTLSGKGKEATFHIDQASLSFGPIAPFEVVERKFIITNTMDRPLEIYSTDYDAQFLEEKDILRAWDKYENSQTFIYPRTIGSALPNDIIVVAEQKLNSMSAGTQDERTVTTGSDDGSKQEADGLGIPTSVHHDNNKTFIVLHGAPYSGKSTFAKKLASHDGVPILRIDELLESTMRKRTPRTPERRESNALRLAGHDGADMLKRSDVNLFKQHKDVDHYDSSQTLSDDQIIEKLRQFLVNEEYHNGFIVDGIDSRFLPNTASLVKFLADFAGPSSYVHFFLLSLEPQQMREREVAREQREKTKEIKLRNCIREIDEDVYNSLSVKARERYDQVLEFYKAQRRSMLQKRSEKPQEQAKGDLKVVEDDKNKRKDKGRRKPKTALKANPAEKDALGKGGKRIEKYDDELNTKNESGENDELLNLMGENLYSQYENYLACLEMLVPLFKDLDRIPSATLRQVAANIAPLDSKKPTKTKANMVSAADSSGAASQALAESEVIISESSAILKIRELAAFGPEESTFAELQSSLPERTRSADTLTKNALQIPEPLTEQVVSYPQGENADDTVGLFFLTPCTTKEEEETESLSISANASSGNLIRRPERRCRWVFQPHESKEFLLRFTSSKVGSWDHPMNFEALGYAASVPIRCTASCQYPSINSNVHALFPKCRPTKESEESIHAGEFITSAQTYDFGALLCGKPKDKNPEKNPENKTAVPITNISNADIKIFFFFDIFVN